MTIDEAIQDFRQLEYEFEHYMCDTEDKKENLMKYQKEWEHYKQLAEWLEELKQRRQTNFDYVSLMDKRYYDGYNKAIDDFVDSLDKHTQENWVEHQEYGMTWSDIERIAEQLKKGGEE